MDNFIWATQAPKRECVSKTASRRCAILQPRPECELNRNFAHQRKTSQTEIMARLPNEYASRVRSSLLFTQLRASEQSQDCRKQRRQHLDALPAKIERQ